MYWITEAEDIDFLAGEEELLSYDFSKPHPRLDNTRMYSMEINVPDFDEVLEWRMFYYAKKGYWIYRLSISNVYTEYNKMPIDDGEAFHLFNDVYYVLTKFNWDRIQGKTRNDILRGVKPTIQRMFRKYRKKLEIP